MFGSDVLEVAIGLILLFLLMSLICTAVREAIEGAFKTRAKDLERGVQQLLHGDKDAAKALQDAFYNHPLITSLYDGPQVSANPSVWLDRIPWLGRTKLPSYIPAGQFAATLMDLATRGTVDAKGTDATGTAIAPPDASDGNVILDTAALVRAQVQKNTLLTPQVKRALITALDQSGGDLVKARQHVELWFDGTMDRVSGWYKRRTQRILFVIGFTSAALLNVDAITIAQRLTTDEALRKAAVSFAEKLEPAKGGGPSPSPQERAPTPTPGPSDVSTAGSRLEGASNSPGGVPAARITAAKAGLKTSSEPVKDELGADDPKQDVLESRSVQQLRGDLSRIGYPVGWKDRVPEAQSKPYLLAWTATSKQKPSRAYQGAGVTGFEVDPDNPKGCWRPVLPQGVDRNNLDFKFKAAPHLYSSCIGPKGLVFALSPYDWLRTLLGWLITAYAVTLGSPFWFDLLNKFMIIRSTVKPREKSREEGSEDHPGPTASDAPKPA